MMMKKPYWLLVLALAMIVAGCADNRVKRVHGKATFDGRPLAGAEVTFWSPDNLSYQATTDADGAFELFQDPRPEAGLRPGPHVVLVARYGRPRVEVKEDTAVPPSEEGFLPGTRNLLPRVYNDKEKSPFKIDLKPGDNEVSLELKSKP